MEQRDLTCQKIKTNLISHVMTKFKDSLMNRSSKAFSYDKYLTVSM